MTVIPHFGPILGVKNVYQLPLFAFFVLYKEHWHLGLHPRSPRRSLQRSSLPLAGQQRCPLPYPSWGGNANSLDYILLHDICSFIIHWLPLASVTAAIPSCWEMVLQDQLLCFGDEGTDQTSHSILFGDVATVQISCLEMGLTIQTC